MSTQTANSDIKWIDKDQTEIEIILNEIKDDISQNGYSDTAVARAWERLALRINWGNSSLPKHRRGWAVKTGLEEAKAQNKFIPGVVLTAIRTNVEREIALPLQPFIVITHFSLYRTKKLGSVRQLDGARFSFCQKFPKEYLTEDLKILLHKREVEMPEGHVCVKITLNARSPQEAIDLSVDHLNFVRGLWNLYRNRFLERLGSHNTPFNPITWGPFLTVHHSDGKLAYKSWLPHPRETPNEYSNWDKSFINALKYEVEARKNIRKLSTEFGTEIKDLIIHYCRALDTPGNPDLALSRLWGVLERITIESTDPHHLIPKRISKLFREEESTRLEMDDIRRLRNAFVHEIQNINHAESFLSTLNTVVAHAIIFLIDHAHHFTSIKDFRAYMSLQCELEEVERKRSALLSKLSILSSASQELPVINSRPAIRSGEEHYYRKP